MKKALAVLLLASAIMLAGCGSAGEEKASAASSDAESAEAVKSEAESSNPAAEAEEEEEIEKGAHVPFAGTATIEDTVLVDEKGIKITASKLSYNSYEATMDLLIENNSDKDLSFISGSLGYSCNAVNGYTVSSIYVNEDVSAGMKANSSISISNTEMELLGITDIAELEIGFQVKDDNYDEYLETGAIKIQTSAAESYDLSEDTYQKAVENGSFSSLSGRKITDFQTGELFSSNGIKLISAALAENKEDGNAVILEVENTTDEFLYFKIGDIAVNDFVVSPSNWDSVSLNPGGRGLLVVNMKDMLEEDEQEAYAIEAISTIEFHATIADAEYKYLAEDETVHIDFDNGDGEGSSAADDSGTELYNKNDVRIVCKGTSDSDSSYYYLLLSITNNTSDTIYVSDEYDEVSVNGFMVDEAAYSTRVEPRQSGAMKYGIKKRSLEDNDISTSDITEVNFQLNIGSGSLYNYIDQPKLTLEVE